MQRRFGAVGLVIGAALLTACGAKTFMNIEQVPVPAEARRDTINGGYEAILDNAANAISTDLKKDYSIVEDKILFLPPDVDAARVFDFYDRNLSEMGFENKNPVEQGRNYRLAVWRKNSWFSGEAVGVAVIRAGQTSEGEAINFLAVYSAQK